MAPSPTPKPSTTSRTGWGGGAKFHTGRWRGHQEKGITLAVSRRVVIPTDGRQVTRCCWRWTADYTEMDGEEAIGRKRERGYGKNVLEDKEPG